MADPSLVVRVAANISELRKNLLEGKDVIETTKAEMTRFANSFDGSKIISQAGAVMAQIQSLGGVTNLTAAEQSRANRVLEEALAKYQALGREAPPGMAKLAAETKQVDATSTKLTDTVKQLAIGFAGMFTARAAFNFVQDTVREAGALKDLSNQTHINVEELQVLAGAMSEFGVDGDTLARGLYMLSRRVAGGDESVEKALAKMGLSLQELDGLNGMELFLKIERGLSRLQGRMRDDVSAELFGGRLGMAMAGASEDIEGAIGTWKEMNAVISKDAVDALDAYDEAITRSEKSIQSLVANAIGPLAEGFNYLDTAARRGASGWDFLKANILDSFDALTGAGAGTAHLTRLIDELNQKTQSQADAGRESTDVVVDQTRALSMSEQAWNLAAKAADAAAESSVVYGDGLPVDAQNDMKAAVEATTNAEAQYRLNLKFTSEALDQRAADLRNIAAAADEAKQKSDAFMNAPTNMGYAAGQTFKTDIGALSSVDAGQIKADFHVAGDQGDTALWRALKQLEQWETGTHPISTLAQFQQLQQNNMRLAQLRQWAQGKTPALADGVQNFDGGLAMVGERGPELVELPRGSNVVPNHAIGGAALHLTVNVNGAVLGTVRELSEMVGRELLNTMRGQGLRVPVGA